MKKSKQVVLSFIILFGVSYFVYHLRCDILSVYEKIAYWLYPSNQDRNGELFKVLLSIFGGLGILYSLHLTYHRLQATNKGLLLQGDAINNQSEQLDLSRKGQIDERFKNAVEHLGSDREPIILGGIVELHQIAIEEKEKYAAVVFNILTSYLRTILNVSLKQDKNSSKTIPQTIIDFLFRDNSNGIYEEQIANLSHCNLFSLDINGSNFNSGNFSFTLMPMNFSDVSFKGAKFARTEFSNGILSDVDFTGADFHDCLFNLCNFEKVVFSNARFAKLIFLNIKFHNCIFSAVNAYNSMYLLCHFENASFNQSDLFMIKFWASNFISVDFSKVKICDKVDFLASGFFRTILRNECFDCNFSGMRNSYLSDYIQIEEVKENIGQPISKVGIIGFDSINFLNCHWNELSQEDYNIINNEYETSINGWRARYNNKKNNNGT